MHLLTIPEYQEFLHKEFAAIEPSLLNGLLLQSFRLDDAEIQRVERALSLGKLPASFTELLKIYDFGNFYILNTQFGADNTGFLDWLLEYNDATKFGLESFLEELRLHSLLVIASGDPFTILLDLRSGDIAALSAEESIETRIPVATSFQKFIEGMATAFIALRTDNNADFQTLAREEFGEASFDFWREISL